MRCLVVRMNHTGVTAAIPADASPPTTAVTPTHSSAPVMERGSEIPTAVLALKSLALRDDLAKRA